MIIRCKHPCFPCCVLGSWTSASNKLMCTSPSTSDYMLLGIIIGAWWTVQWEYIPKYRPWIVAWFDIWRAAKVVYNVIFVRLQVMIRYYHWCMMNIEILMTAAMIQDLNHHRSILKFCKLTSFCERQSPAVARLNWLLLQNRNVCFSCI